MQVESMCPADVVDQSAGGGHNDVHQTLVATGTVGNIIFKHPNTLFNFKLVHQSGQNCTNPHDRNKQVVCKYSAL